MRTQLVAGRRWIRDLGAPARWRYFAIYMSPRQTALSRGDLEGVLA